MVADNFIAFMSFASKASIIPLHNIGINLYFTLALHQAQKR